MEEVADDQYGGRPGQDPNGLPCSRRGRGQIKGRDPQNVENTEDYLQDGWQTHASDPVAAKLRRRFSDSIPVNVRNGSGADCRLRVGSGRLLPHA